MKQEQIDLWDKKFDIKCITTNLTVLETGKNVMGGGCAREAAQRFPKLPQEYGAMIKEGFRGIRLLNRGKTLLLMFPVKYEVWEPADLGLIEKSCQELSKALEHMASDISIALPRPGCGLGGLDWETQVKPICEKYFDDRVTVVGYVGEK